MVIPTISERQRASWGKPNASKLARESMSMTAYGCDSSRAPMFAHAHVILLVFAICVCTAYVVVQTQLSGTFRAFVKKNVELHGIFVNKNVDFYIFLDE